MLGSVVKMNTRLLFAPLLLALLLAGCSGSEEKFPKVITITDDQVQPIIANSEIVVGLNRLVLGIIGPEGRLLIDAKVHLVFYELATSGAIQRFETDAVSSVPARDAGVTEQVEHIHADASRHTHLNAGEDVGFYSALVNLDKPGDWGVEMQVVSQNPPFNGKLLPRFNVIERGSTPAVGSAAPKTVNRTVKDVADLAQIDSSAKPSPEMHTTTVAAAIEAGKPALVLFAVPGFCESRLCGPELEIMRKLLPKYQSKAEFIHIEFYENPGASARVPVQAVVDWNLRSEPWFFVIDAKGLIAAKFEGPASLQELEEALQKVVAGG